MADSNRRGASDDPVKRRGNDERDDRFPYGGDRAGKTRANQSATLTEPVPQPAARRSPRRRPAR